MSTPELRNLIQTWEKQAASAYREKRNNLAAEGYMRVADGYIQLGDELSAAEARNNASVACLQMDDAAQAHQLVDGTAQIFAQAGDKRRQGIALGNLAAALDALGRVTEAENAYREAAHWLGEAGEAEMKAQALQALSALLLRRGKHLEALATMQAGLEEHPHPTPKMKWVRRLLRLPFDLFQKGA